MKFSRASLPLDQVPARSFSKALFPSRYVNVGTVLSSPRSLGASMDADGLALVALHDVHS